MRGRHLRGTGKRLGRVGVRVPLGGEGCSQWAEGLVRARLALPPRPPQARAARAPLPGGPAARCGQCPWGAALSAACRTPSHVACGASLACDAKNLRPRLCLHGHLRLREPPLCVHPLFFAVADAPLASALAPLGTGAGVARPSTAGRGCGPLPTRQLGSLGTRVPTATAAADGEGPLQPVSLFVAWPPVAPHAGPAIRAHRCSFAARSSLTARNPLPGHEAPHAHATHPRAPRASTQPAPVPASPLAPCSGGAPGSAAAAAAALRGSQLLAELEAELRTLGGADDGGEGGADEEGLGVCGGRGGTVGAGQGETEAEGEAALEPLLAWSAQLQGLLSRMDGLSSGYQVQTRSQRRAVLSRPPRSQASVCFPAGIRGAGCMSARRAGSRGGHCGLTSRAHGERAAQFAPVSVYAGHGRLVQADRVSRSSTPVKPGPPAAL